MSVLVYLVDPDGRVHETARLFQNRLFNFEAINIEKSSNNESSNHLSDPHRDVHSYLHILERAKATSPAAHVIILRRDMMSNFNHERLAMLISSLTSHVDTDVFYLSKSLDRCDLYDQQQRIKHQGRDLGHLTARTYQPNGIQALMFSSRGRDIIIDQNLSMSPSKNDSFNQFLRDLVRNQSLIAESVIPNVFSFDISRAQNADDLMLLNECMPPPSSTSSSSMSVLIFIAVIVLVLIIAFLALWLGRVKLNP